MARLPRFSPAGLPALVLQRGNNRQPVFLGPDDYLHYLDCRACPRASMNWPFMPTRCARNHIHLVATPKGARFLSLAMQAVGRRYARHFNQVANRTGTLWRGAFASA